MEFAKYYNVSDIVDTMMEKKEIDCYPTGEDKFLRVYQTISRKLPPL